MTRHDPFALFRENLRAREGGYVDDPHDPGGATDGGICAAFLVRYNAAHPEACLPTDPAALSEAQKTRLFRDEFYDRPRLAELAALAPQLAEQIFDTGVLHGPARAGTWLQTALNETLGVDLAVDGAIGPRTRAAVREAVERGRIAEVNDRVVALRLAFMRRLPGFARFGRGWTRRAESFRHSVTASA